jgi:hypothetical protein
MIDNRAQNIPCYHPGYTLVEKLQTISTKFRKEQETHAFSENFMRHYYDVFCLLKNPDIQEFLGTEAYSAHKERRFRSADNKEIKSNEAFILSTKETRKRYEDQYNQSKSLYYHHKPSFDEILDLIKENLSKL